jgi:hypothetical protein
LIPPGLLATEPSPVTPTETLKVCCCCGCGWGFGWGGVLRRRKVAMTLRSFVMWTVQGPVSLSQSPLQPANTQPADAFAVSTTCSSWK